jgi:thiol-disulfide isomerase/thioredoxin
MMHLVIVAMLAQVPPPSFATAAPAPRFSERAPVPQFQERTPDFPLPVPDPAPKTDTGLSLVMVTSKTCGPCQKMRPILDRVGGAWSVRYIDADNPQAKQWLEVYGITSVPYYVTYRGHEAIEVANGLMSLEEVLGWLGRVEQGLPPDADSRFKRCAAQDSLKPLDREYLQMRLTPGSCGMLGCMAHGGGWVTETVAGAPDVAKPKGHWEVRAVQQSGCPGGSCPTGGCPTGATQRIWIADPDPTGTVPWPSQGSGAFGRRRQVQ